MIDLEAIRARNEQWKLAVDVCQECGAGQEGYPAPDDIDALLAEVERLRDMVGTIESAPDGPLTLSRKNGRMTLTVGIAPSEWNGDEGDARS